MSPTWREIARDSRPQASHEQQELVELLLAVSPDARLFQSAAGSEAVLLGSDAVEAAPDVGLELEDGPQEFNVVGVIVPAGDEKDVGGMLKHCDAVALPEVHADMSPPQMAPFGEMAFPGAPAPYILFRNQPADMDLLSRGAPLGIAEPDDNLDSREKWFRKRHGS